MTGACCFGDQGYYSEICLPFHATSSKELLDCRNKRATNDIPVIFEKLSSNFHFNWFIKRDYAFGYLTVFNKKNFIY